MINSLNNSQQSNTNVPTTAPQSDQQDLVASQVNKLADLHFYAKLLQPEESPPPPKFTIHEKNISKINPYFNVTGTFAAGTGGFLLFDYNASPGTLAIIGLCLAVFGLVIGLFSSISSIRVTKVENKIQQWEQQEYTRKMQNANHLKFLHTFRELFTENENILSKASDCLDKLFQCNEYYKNLIDSLQKKVSVIFARIQKYLDDGLASETEKQDYQELYKLVSKTLKMIQQQANEINEMRKQGNENFSGEKLGWDDLPHQGFKNGNQRLTEKFINNWKKAMEIGSVELDYLWINGKWISRHAGIFDSEEEVRKYVKPTTEYTVTKNREVILTIEESPQH